MKAKLIYNCEYFEAPGAKQPTYANVVCVCVCVATNLQYNFNKWYGEITNFWNIYQIPHTG
jgi:hypothetical protein